MPLGQHSTAFDREIEAIRTALHLLNLHQNKFERAVTFSDSKGCNTICRINRNCDINGSQRLPGPNMTN
jgi:hypothetical protein